MGRLVVECLQKKVNVRKIAKAVYKTLGQVSRIKVELIFESGEGIQTLNSRERGVDKVTDVLSFPTLDGIRGEILLPENCKTEIDGRFIFLGSIVLCEEKIREQAREYGHSEQRERDYLIIHGLLHLFGFDHMTDEDKKQMRAIEKKVLKMLKVEE